MTCDKIYFYDPTSPSILLQIIIFLGGCTFIIGAYRFTTPDQAIEYLMLFIGLIFILWPVFIYAYRKGHLRGYIILSENGLSIRKWPYLKTNNFAWNDCKKIDISLFEPRVQLKNGKELTQIMQYEQQLKYRNALRKKAEKLGIEIINAN